MKKLLALLISSSLMLSVAALAQQPTPGKKKKQRQQAQQGNQQAQQGKRQAQGNRAQGAQTGQHRPKARANNAQQGQRKSRGNAHAAGNANAQAQRPSKRNAKRQTAAANNAPSQTAPGRSKAKRQNQKSVAAGQANQPNRGNQANQPNRHANKRTGKGRPNAQQVQQIRSRHANFHAQARPQKVKAVTFNQSHRIHGAQHWQGPRYNVFRSYRPQRHDRGWWHSHYNNIVLIGGGYYYFDAGYWYPAWGYAPSESYYVYDGPIYTGKVALPPDQVIANVQAVLQEQGYYTGEVDGLLGPLTREALTAYQSDNGLYTTAAIDEPTLDSLGMTS